MLNAMEASNNTVLNSIEEKIRSVLDERLNPIEEKMKLILQHVDQVHGGTHARPAIRGATSHMMPNLSARTKQSREARFFDGMKI